MSGATESADLVVRDAELLVTMTGQELRGGWVAIKDGIVAAVGAPGEEPEATDVLSASGCLVTPGLINTHHHIYQNLTRSYTESFTMTATPHLTSSWPDVS